MLRGRFGDTTTRPYIEGRVSIPSLKKWADVFFCFDTGADGILLMPVDTLRMGIDFKDPSHIRKPLYGIGSGATGILLKAILAFLDDSGDIFTYDVPVFAADPCDAIKDAPSLLGRTIIHRWRVNYDGGAKVLEATILSSDYKIPRTPKPGSPT